MDPHDNYVINLKYIELEYLSISNSTLIFFREKCLGLISIGVVIGWDYWASLGMCGHVEWDSKEEKDVVIILI
jgi:hypothetical protein